MNFAEPTYLFGFLLLLPLGLLVWRAERRRRSLLARLGEMPLLARLTETVNDNGRKWTARLWFVALSLLLSALARPQWGSETQLVQQEGVQVMVVLDVSTSMLADDLRPNRLAQAKQSMVELMESLDGDEVGLVLFSGASFIQFPLTTDYGTARSFLDAAGPNAISRGGSVLGQALETAVSGFNLQRDSQRVIVVMTDGESHEGNPIEAATAAADSGVIIYTLGFGSPEGEAVPQLDAQGRVVGSRLDSQGSVILSRLDEATLQAVAEVANGRYFRATASGQEIKALAGEISQLQAAQLESRFQTQRIERFQLFLGAAIGLLLVVTLIPERKTAVAKEAQLRTITEPAKAKKPRFTPINQSTNLLILLLLLGGCTTAPTPADQINSGNTAYESGEFDAALSEYQEAIAALPETAEPIYNSANALFRNQQLAEAQAQMDVALLDANEALAADAYFNLGNFYYSQQDYVNAIEAYKSGLRLNPNDEDAKHNLELALMQQQEQAGGEEEQEEEQPEEREEGEEEQEEPEQSEEPQEEEQPEEEQAGEEESEEPQEEEQEQAGGDQDENAEETPPESPADPEENSSSQQPPVEGLTEEQAYQLLEAIGQQTETLQEFLQEQFTAPGGPPERDW